MTLLKSFLSDIAARNPCIVAKPAAVARPFKLNDHSFLGAPLRAPTTFGTLETIFDFMPINNRPRYCRRAAGLRFVRRECGDAASSFSSFSSAATKAARLGVPGVAAWAPGRVSGSCHVAALLEMLFVASSRPASVAPARSPPVSPPAAAFAAAAAAAAAAAILDVVATPTIAVVAVDALAINPATSADAPAMKATALSGRRDLGSVFGCGSSKGDVMGCDQRCAGDQTLPMRVGAVIRVTMARDKGTLLFLRGRWLSSASEVRAQIWTSWSRCCKEQQLKSCSQEVLAQSGGGMGQCGPSQGPVHSSG